MSGKHMGMGHVSSAGSAAAKPGASQHLPRPPADGPDQVDVPRYWRAPDGSCEYIMVGKGAGRKEHMVPPGFTGMLFEVLYRVIARCQDTERAEIDSQSKANLAPLISRILQLEISVKELLDEVALLKSKSAASRPIRKSPVRVR